MSKHTFISLLIIVLATVIAFTGCKKPENLEQSINDTVAADTVVPEDPEEPADNIYQFKVLDGNGDRRQGRTTTSTTSAPAAMASHSPNLPRST